MSHILEVVVAAFLVGVAGSVVGFLIEKKIRDRIEKGRTFQLWTVGCALLGAAALVVVLGFFADSLTFRFSPRMVSIQIPNPQVAAGATRVSLLLLFPFAAAFFLFVRSVEMSFRTDERPEEFDPSLGMLRLPKTEHGNHYRDYVPVLQISALCRLVKIGPHAAATGIGVHKLRDR